MARNTDSFIRCGRTASITTGLLKIPNSSYASAIIQKAVIMSKAYADANGGPVLSAKDVLNLPKYVFDELIAETDTAEKRDSERTVESAPSAKNGKGSGR